VPREHMDVRSGPRVRRRESPQDSREKNPPHPLGHLSEIEYCATPPFLERFCQDKRRPRVKQLPGYRNANLLRPRDLTWRARRAERSH
jgi:hypothetical protein